MRRALLLVWERGPSSRLGVRLSQSPRSSHFAAVLRIFARYSATAARIRSSASG